MSRSGMSRPSVYRRSLPLTERRRVAIYSRSPPAMVPCPHLGRTYGRCNPWESDNPASLNLPAFTVNSSRCFHRGIVSRNALLSHYLTVGWSPRRPAGPTVHERRRRETSAAFVVLSPKPKPVAGFASGRGCSWSLGPNAVDNRLGSGRRSGRRVWAGVSESLVETWAGVIGWLSLEGRRQL